MAYNRSRPTTRGPFPRTINYGDPLAYRLVQSWPLNETGTLFHNAANQVRCVTTGTPVFDPSGPFGSALKFTNGDWSINAGTIPGPATTTPQLGLWPTAGDWAVSYWMKSSTITGQTWVCLSLDQDYWWGFNATGLFAMGANGTGYTGTINVADGLWHHVVTTIRANVLKVFIDGRLDVDTAATKPLDTGTAVYFGIYETAGFNFTGSLAGVNIWSRALFQEEARQLYSEPWRIYVPERRRVSATAEPAVATGTLAATTPVAASAATGTVAVASALAATTPVATLAATATVSTDTITGALAATTPVATIAATGTVAAAGALAATTPIATVVSAAVVPVASALAVTTPVAAMAGTATVLDGPSGVLAATTPVATIAATATVAVAGALAATTPVATFAGAPVTLNVVGAGTTTSGGGLIATSAQALTGARTSFGRSTGKWMVQGTILTGGFAGDTGVNFGFMSSGGTLATAVPGGNGSPVGTGFSLGPQGRYLFSNAFYRSRLQTNAVYILTYPATTTIAIDLDAKKFWWCSTDGVTDTGWQFDDGTATPQLDPTLATGTSYATYITDSDTIFPFIFFEGSGQSGSMDFSPIGTPSASGFLAWDEGATDTAAANVAVSAALATTTPVATFAGTGAVTIGPMGDLAATTPVAVISSTGTVAVTAALAATTPVATMVARETEAVSAPATGGWIDPHTARQLLRQAQAYQKNIDRLRREPREEREAAQAAMNATLERVYAEITGEKLPEAAEIPAQLAELKPEVRAPVKAVHNAVAVYAAVVKMDDGPAMDAALLALDKAIMRLRIAAQEEDDETVLLLAAYT